MPSLTTVDLPNDAFGKRKSFHTFSASLCFSSQLDIGALINYIHSPLSCKTPTPHHPHNSTSRLTQFPLFSLNYPSQSPSTMFAATARRFARVGIRSAKQFNSSVSISHATHSHVGYVLAVGAAGVASIALLKKHLSAQEPESGYLYTWFVPFLCIITQ